MCDTKLGRSKTTKLFRLHPSVNSSPEQKENSFDLRGHLWGINNGCGRYKVDRLKKGKEVLSVLTMSECVPLHTSHRSRFFVVVLSVVCVCVVFGVEPRASYMLDKQTSALPQNCISYLLFTFYFKTRSH